MADPMGPADREALLSFLDQADMAHDAADADRPHILVSVGDGQVEACIGPFPDLWTATAYAPTWDAQINEGAGPDHRSKIQAHVLYPPPEGAS